MGDFVIDPGTAGRISSDEHADSQSSAATNGRTTHFALMLGVAAAASGAAGLIHAVAVGIHADTPDLSRIFILFAAVQVGTAALVIAHPGRRSALALGSVNVLAVVGWVVTRLVGISFVGGLEVAERPQFADGTAAAFAAVAVIGVLSSLGLRSENNARLPIMIPAMLAAVLAIPAMVSASSHQHSGGDAAAHAHGDGPGAAAATGSDDHDNHDDADATDAEPAAAADDHDHADQAGQAASGEHAVHTDEVAAASPTWPRPWDPTAPIDVSGVEGVSPDQEARATALIENTLAVLPQFADVTTLAPLGFRSIGDESTGFEHYINTGYINDELFLDPSAPESLVYEVDGDARTLVSAMYIAKQTPIDDPVLVDYGGPLMQWHVHLNLCWGLDDSGVPKVMGVTDDNGGACPPGTINAGGENPMVHVWIAPHECGPFAALEGHGAGQAAADDGARTDQCSHESGDGHGAHDEAQTVPYDPELPIDLGGVPGVTPQQQAYAENLVAATVRDLPQWADLDAVKAAGFKSIGDASTGHEHFIQWDWIDDDIVLDPDYPESLVFEPQPDGTKTLVSAMFMMPSGTRLDDIPDFGGALMQWHVHGDLCFTDEPDAPLVAGLKPVGTDCAPPLVNGTLAPMIHVWIRKHECGPFAALDGIGAGQVPDGEEHLCDTAHGGH